MTNNIQDLQSIIDDQKENLSDGSYLSMCKLTQKIMNNSINGFYEIDYLESFLTKIDGSYQVDFKPYKTCIRMSDKTFNDLQKKIEEEKIVKLCYHSLSEEFINLKIVKQEICSETICTDCSEMVCNELEVRNNVLIRKITKC
jgi:hypothetical protein